MAWLAAASDPAIARARHRMFAARAEAASSTMSTGVFRWAAGEALGDPFRPPRETDPAAGD